MIRRKSLIAPILHRDDPKPRPGIKIACNVVVLDLFPGGLTETEIAVCAKLNVSHADYLRAKAADRRGDDPLTGTTMGRQPRGAGAGYGFTPSNGAGYHKVL